MLIVSAVFELEVVLEKETAHYFFPCDDSRAPLESA
jgi:hypothetical protein